VPKNKICLVTMNENNRRNVNFGVVAEVAKTKISHKTEHYFPLFSLKFNDIFFLISYYRYIPELEACFRVSSVTRQKVYIMNLHILPGHRCFYFFKLIIILIPIVAYSLTIAHTHTAIIILYRDV